MAVRDYSESWPGITANFNEDGSISFMSEEYGSYDTGQYGVGTFRVVLIDCGRRFDGGIPRDKVRVITDYMEGKQTLEQLAVKYGVNEKTIRRDLEGMRHVHKIAKHKGCDRSDGHHLLGQVLRTDGHPGRPAWQCPVAQIRQA